MLKRCVGTTGGMWYVNRQVPQIEIYSGSDTPSVR